MQFQMIFAVALGGAIGAVGRFLIGSFVQRSLGASFPFGTLSVNILGSFIIGFLFLYFEQTLAPTQKALLVTGVMGALTTFSTFSLETLLMLQGGLYQKAVINILLNIILSIGATLLGVLIFKKIYSI
jgi:CrcB protein